MDIVSFTCRKKGALHGADQTLPSVVLVATLGPAPVKHHLIPGSSSADEIDHVISFHLPANPNVLSDTSRWPT